ncbi:hypothetical protein X738_28705 [Mesorhizobium sp. LNHC209A00]|nr:hypothetical protein X738_28705 [Mesorhizobium sp. LNHC209A00]
MLRSVPFGEVLTQQPLVFSLMPRCHGLCGSQKYLDTRVDLETIVLSQFRLPHPTAANNAVLRMMVRVIASRTGLSSMSREHRPVLCEELRSAPRGGEDAAAS